ncbi:MAG: hypothetical protein IJ877_00515 [Candidatus Gastranaerophilales bacterium]|nr:hypothetical protein [Candidatus Gastranaerophilales bacterium]
MPQEQNPAAKSAAKNNEKSDLKQLLANKPLLYTIAGSVGVVVVMFIIMIAVLLNVGSANSANPNQSKQIKASEKVIKNDPVTLFTTESTGKALEVQALLAREQITAAKVDNGSKVSIVLKEYTQDQRDRALLAIVKSGLLDEHTGLEIFDKGDFTATKDDKKIRLVRAINGELARLIRKIPPIENAQVFISIPEQTFFAQNQKPITATVQITMPSGERLDNMKIKAISNLLLGAVHGLTVDNISITDTNGTVYNSIIGASDDAIAKIEENDKYMQSKVSAQLDKLLGKGNYVATVSTFLTQAPVEKSSIIYDPDKKTSVTEQQFKESLGDNQSDSTSSGMNPVSLYVPDGVKGTVQKGTSSQDRQYARTATETQYGVSKTQVNEYLDAGIIEKISIAVSIEESAIPTNMSLEELKVLIANAASPKVSPDDVSIAFVESNSLVLAPDKENELPKPEESGNPWWTVGVILLIGLVVGLSHIGGKVKTEARKQEEELEYLRQVTATQEQQLKEVTSQASNLIAKQEQMAQNLIEQKNQYTLAIEQVKSAQAAAAQAQAQAAQAQAMPRFNLSDAIDELETDFNAVDESEAIEKIKNWIESA